MSIVVATVQRKSSYQIDMIQANMTFDMYSNVYVNLTKCNISKGCHPKNSVFTDIGLKEGIYISHISQNSEFFQNFPKIVKLQRPAGSGKYPF